MQVSKYSYMETGNVTCSHKIAAAGGVLKNGGPTLDHGQ